MPRIRPVSDLRNKFSNISKTVHETAEPVFLTKNRYGYVVVMSMEASKHYKFESEVYFKLREAELEYKTTDKRHSHKELFDGLRAEFPDRTEIDDANKQIVIRRIPKKHRTLKERVSGYVGSYEAKEWDTGESYGK